MRVELHSHTIYSKDCLVSLEAYIAECRRKGLSRAAITDHNTAEGALRAAQLAPDLIIVGEEVRTTHGELLAYFLTETIPPDLSPQETLKRIRDQGGVIGVSHPADRVRREAMGLKRLPVVLDHIDALEVFNARCVFQEDNQRAAQIAQERGLIGFSGSDAHTLYELGRAAMEMSPFHDQQSFLQSMRTGQISTQASSHLVHFASTWAKWLKRLGLVKRP